MIKMLQNLFQFDIFELINGIFIIAFVVVIIFFIIVILIVYKLFHANVDNIKEKSKKASEVRFKSSESATNGLGKEDSISMSNVNICKYCGQSIEENTAFCQYCGSNLAH